MKLETRIKRDIKDYEMADICNTCCLSCKSFDTVKEQNNKCEIRKARARIINRKVRDAVKADHEKNN